MSNDTLLDDSSITMKAYIPILAVVIAVLNALLFLPALSAFSAVIAGIGILLALAIAAGTFTKETNEKPAAKNIPASSTPPQVVETAKQNDNATNAQIVALLGRFQEKGRLIDFLMDDVTSYDDAQVGAAARVIHQGCQDVLREDFEIVPVSTSAEGSKVTVPAGYSTGEFRLIGKANGQPPFVGTLLHKGWKTTSIKLPRVINSEANKLPPIAPAEVEIV